MSDSQPQRFATIADATWACELLELQIKELRAENARLQSELHGEATEAHNANDTLLALYVKLSKECDELRIAITTALDKMGDSSPGQYAPGESELREALNRPRPCA
jgi:hypothetical protein